MLRYRRAGSHDRLTRLESLERREYLNVDSSVSALLAVDLPIAPVAQLATTTVGVSAQTAADPGRTIDTPYDSFPNFAHADFAEGRTILESAQGGNWSMLFPAVRRDDVLIIRHHVIFDMPLAEVYTLALYPGAHLEFVTAMPTQLKAVNILVAEGAHLQIGSAAAPIQGNAKAQIVLRNEPFNTALDPQQFGHGLIALGKVTMHGASVTSGATGALLASEPLAGDTTLVLATAPTGWNAGDTLVIPDTKAVTQGEILAAFPFSAELVTIAAVNGNQVVLTAPLGDDHLGARDADGTLRFLPHVAHLSRNVVIKSESSAGTRGHVLFTRRAEIDIRYSAFAGLGRTTTDPIDDTTFDSSGNVTHVGTNQQGRYAVHMHHLIGPVAAPANGYQFTFLGNSVFCGMPTHQFKWGITLHDSHYGLIQNNTIYNWAGAGLATESGTESYNVIERNLVLTSRGPNQADNFLSDFGDMDGNHGSGFWIRAANNFVRDNVAANGRRYGFVMETKDLKTAERIPLFQGADTSVAGEYATVRLDQINPLDFRNNEAYATMIGFSFYGTQGTDYNVYDLKAWAPARAGLYTYYAVAGPVKMHNIVVRGNGDLSTTTQPAGVAHDTYSAIYVDGFDIQGLRRGIQVIGWQSAFINNGTLINAANITQQYGVPTNSPVTVTTIRNVRFGTLPGWVLNAIDMLVTPDLPDLFGKNQVFVEDYDGVAGDNFQVYYAEQVASWVIPATATAAPQTLITNQESWNRYGVAMAGAVAPSNTYLRPGINGLSRSTTSDIGTGSGESLVAYWSFNEGHGDRVPDTAPGGQDNSGILFGGARWTAEGLNGALYFDGVIDYLDIPDSPDINLGIHRAHTVALQFNVQNAALTTRKQVLWEQGGSSRGLSIYVYNGRLYVGGWNNTPGQSGWQGTFLSAPVTSGEWHHVALVLNGGPTLQPGVLAAYLDGTMYASGDGSQLWDHGDDIGIGRTDGTTRFHSGPSVGIVDGFAGWIDEVRVYTRALDAAEILALAGELATAELSLSVTTASAPEGGPPVSVTVTRNGDLSLDLVVNLSSSDTTAATTPTFVTIPAGQASATFDLTPVDDSLIDGTQSVVATATATGFVDGTVTIDVLDDDTVSDVGLVAYWNFDEGSGTRAFDTSPHGADHTGTLMYDAAWSSEGINGSLDFDGVGDYVDVPDSVDINVGIHAKHTVALWFKADDASIASRRQVLYEQGGWNRGLGIYLFDGQIFVGGWNTTVTQSNWQGTFLSVPVSSGEWHHVALVLDGTPVLTPGALTAYLDGVAYATGDGSQIWDHGDDIGIGRVDGATRFHDGLSVGIVDAFAGLIDEVRVYTRPLTAVEVSNLAALATPTGLAAAGTSTLALGSALTALVADTADSGFLGSMDPPSELAPSANAAKGQDAAHDAVFLQLGAPTENRYGVNEASAEQSIANRRPLDRRRFDPIQHAISSTTESRWDWLV